jgi:hypothetical protein
METNKSKDQLVLRRQGAYVVATRGSMELLASALIAVRHVTQADEDSRERALAVEHLDSLNGQIMEVLHTVHTPTGYVWVEERGGNLYYELRDERDQPLLSSLAASRELMLERLSALLRLFGGEVLVVKHHDEGGRHSLSFEVTRDGVIQNAQEIPLRYAPSKIGGETPALPPL